MSVRGDDPREWPNKLKVKFLAGSLIEFLSVVPTAHHMGQSLSATRAPLEEIADRTKRAEEISESMDEVYRSMNDRPNA